MVHKTASVSGKGFENPEPKRKNQSFKLTISSCLSTRHFITDASLRKHFVHVEEALRKMVREAVEPTVLRHYQSIPRSLSNGAEAAEPSKLRKFRLQFDGALPNELYTGNSIEPKRSVPLRILLLDSESGEVVEHDPLSSVKVKIVVLSGHFEVEDLEDWTKEKFNDNIVRARADKGSLLVGNCVIRLCKGIGFVIGIKFTDNSSWERSKMFRLGAKVEAKMAEEDQVREAVSCPFKVKHRRGESYQKDSALSLEHDVWHVKGIAKNGKTHKNLEDKRIFKVRDLVRTYHTDQSSLRKILGSPKTLKEVAQQMKKLCPRNECTIQSNSAPSLIPADAVLKSNVPFSAAAASQDEQEAQMAYAHPMVTSQWADDSMKLNVNTLIDRGPMTNELLANSYDEVQNMSLGCNLQPTSNWSTDPQSIVAVGNGSFWGATSASPMGILPSMLDLGASTSQNAVDANGVFGAGFGLC